MPRQDSNRIRQQIGATLDPRGGRTSSGQINALWLGSAGTPQFLEYIVIAGGGSGGSNANNYGTGGGGAGGFRSSITGEYSGRGAVAESPINTATGSGLYTITVGGAGSGSSIARTGLTTISTLAGSNGVNGNGTGANVTGGSGGGGATYCSSYSWSTYAGGLGTAGQGYDGNYGNNGGAYIDGRCNHSGWFGAFANAGRLNGNNNTVTTGQSGNYGYKTYAMSAAGDLLGRGGGFSEGCNYCGQYYYYYNGDGTTYTSAGAVPAATVNTGSGGQGGAGAVGSSGLVVIRYLDIYDDATVTGNPVQLSVGGYKVYKFTGNGTLGF